MINVTDEDFIIAFGKHLKQLRSERGFTQEALAFRFEPQTSSNQIGRIERGEINTTLSTIKVIARALDISVSTLFEFDNK